ncbi:MAG: hypothetical protein WCT39_02295 [Candidatus Margulisiibacteriota bacterium]
MKKSWLVLLAIAVCVLFLGTARADKIIHREFALGPFKTNSAKLTPEMQADVIKIAPALPKEGAVVQVLAGTSSSGSPEFNSRLRELRGQELTEALKKITPNAKYLEPGVLDGVDAKMAIIVVTASESAFPDYRATSFAPTVVSTIPEAYLKNASEALNAAIASKDAAEEARDAAKTTGGKVDGLENKVDGVGDKVDQAKTMLNQVYNGVVAIAALIVALCLFFVCRYVYRRRRNSQVFEIPALADEVTEGSFPREHQFTVHPEASQGSKYACKVKVQETGPGMFLSPIRPGSNPVKKSKVISSIVSDLEMFGGAKMSSENFLRGPYRQNIRDLIGSGIIEPIDEDMTDSDPGAPDHNQPGGNQGVQNGVQGTLTGILALFFCLGLIACGGPNATKRSEMYMAPLLPETSGEAVLISYVVNSLVETADNDEKGMVISWKGILVNPEGEYQEMLVLNIGQIDDTRLSYYMAVIPSPMSKIGSHRFLPLDHASRRVYNHKGNEMLLKLKDRGKKVDLKFYGDWIPTLAELEKEGYAVPLTAHSETYDKLLGFYQSIRLQEVEAGKRYIHQRYGTNLTVEQLNEIAKEDAIAGRLKKFLLSDWKIFFSFPISSPQAMGAFMLASKAFSIPSIFQDDVDKPGYQDRKVSARDVITIMHQVARKDYELKPVGQRSLHVPYNAN